MFSVHEAVPVTAFSALVIASHNAGKVREIRELLAPMGIAVSSAAEHNVPEPEETGSDFAENALIKARAVCAATGLPALSDDSGLCVTDLGNAPGIYSARWAGPEKDFAIAMRRIETMLNESAAPPPWQAFFVCALALVLPGNTDAENVFEGRVNGTLTFPPRGAQGFGYDPIFVPAGDTRSFAEMPAAEKHTISHRARAFALFTDWLAARR